ncbi:MAG: carbohydrate kinase family protein [Clostridia bacterium]|nr:carbohydrate kinase family protein [Clostridia bacterium]
MKRIACVGILVADVIVEPVDGYPGHGVLKQVNGITLHNGGNAMTASINLTKMGTPAFIVGKVGDDMFGAYLKSRLEAAGVDTAGLKTDTTTQTSASVLMIDEGGERSFFHCVGTNGTFGIDDIDFDVISKADLVFVTGTYLLDRFDGEETRDFLKKCKEMGKTTFLDVCWDAKGKWGELLDMSMPYIDFLMPSIDEAREIAKRSDPDEIADVFMAKGAKNVVIKMGKTGSYLRLAGEKKGRIFPSVKGVKAVDTTGAGDSFCSGFLAAYARGESPEFCSEFANGTGALCVTATGATTGIRTYEETLEFLGEKKC